MISKKIEVFRTNVSTRKKAHELVLALHRKFPIYQLNFDLEDCDKILRVASHSGLIEPDLLLKFLEEQGIQAEVLEDEISRNR